MPEVELLATGEGDDRHHDPDVVRARVRDRKRRDVVDTTTGADAVSGLVADGVDVAFGVSSFTRGPIVPIREIVRPRRRNLRYGATFIGTLVERAART